MGDRRSNNGIHRRLVLLAAIVLFSVATGMPVRAEGQDLDRVYTIVTSSEVSLAQEGPEGSAPEFTSEGDAGLYVREQMKLRKETIRFNYVEIDKNISFSSDSELNGLVQTESSKIWANIYSGIFDNTGKANEGDYLRNSLSSISMRAEAQMNMVPGSKSVNLKKINYQISIVYYSNAEQEKVFENKAASVVNELNLSSDSEYEKVVKIYDYITNHVTYDYAHLEDQSYLIKQSAYAALINGTSVCQGYATLFYYMATYAGLDSRIIMGKSFDEQGSSAELHAWNAIKIGDLYYYVDATWDSGNVEDVYFLKGTSDFTKHIDIYMETPNGEVDPTKVIAFSRSSYYSSITKTQVNDSNTQVTVGDVTMKNGYPSVKVEVVFGGKKLLAGIDYRVSYGTYYTDIRKGTVKVEGIGLYRGTITKEYEVPENAIQNDKTQSDKDKSDTGKTSADKTSSKTTSSKKSVKVGTKFKVGRLTYKVTKAGSTKTVSLVAADVKNLNSVKIPDSVRKGGDVFIVKAIGNNVFKNNSKLTSVVIGKNVESIGANCFSGCKKLKKITFRGTSLKKVGKNALKKTNASITVSVPKSVKSKYVKLLKIGGISKKARYK
jgi:hypothetical protein